MKSPTSSVGRIEELGILNGSAINERSRKTIRSTGKKLFGYSIHHGSGLPAGRFRAHSTRSASAITPVTTVSKNSIRAKFMNRCVFFFQAEDGIRDFTVTGVQTCALPI